MSIIYRWTNLINRKVYIGSTKNPSKRRSAHNTGKAGSQVLFDALNKYGRNNFLYEILEYIDSSNITYIFEREQVYLDMYGAQEYILTGDNKGMFKTLTYNLKPLADSMRGYRYTNEQKEVFKKSLSKANEINKEKGRENKIIVIDINLNIIDECNGTKEVSNKYKVDQRNITNCCNGKIHTLGGYVFAFKGKEIEKIEYIKNTSTYFRQYYITQTTKAKKFK